jgi:hypothetical protein
MTYRDTPPPTNNATNVGHLKEEEVEKEAVVEWEGGGEREV